MTMKELSEKLGISEGYYCYIEQGVRQKKMDITLASKLATIFGMTLSEVVKLEEACTEATRRSGRFSPDGRQ